MAGSGCRGLIRDIESADIRLARKTPEEEFLNLLENVRDDESVALGTFFEPCICPAPSWSGALRSLKKDEAQRFKALKREAV